jgi:hypothetical protein
VILPRTPTPRTDFGSKVNGDKTTPKLIDPAAAPGLNRLILGEAMTMKLPKSLCNGILAMALAAAGLAAGEVSARADIMFDVSNAVATPLPISGVATPACSTTCTLGGDIVINTGTGAVVSADVTASGFSPSVGPFKQLGLGGTFKGEFFFQNIADSAGNILELDFPPTTLVNYTGGQVGGSVILPSESEWGVSGSLTAVPAPPIGRGLPVVLALGGMLLGAKLLKRSRRRRLIATAA